MLLLRSLTLVCTALLISNMLVRGPEGFQTSYLLGGLAGAFMAAERVATPKKRSSKPRSSPSPYYVGPPEHIHWPDEVLSILEEPVGRHVCAECLDECPAMPTMTLRGEEAVIHFRSSDQTTWVRTRSGEVIQLGMTLEY